MGEKQCDEQSAFRYTWPGKDEQHICLGHGASVRKMAEAIGMHLQLIPLNAEEWAASTGCHQLVNDE